MILDNYALIRYPFCRCSKVAPVHVARADRIVVLAAGEIADIGTHFELLNRCALYRTACERQQNRLPMPNNS